MSRETQRDRIAQALAQRGRIMGSPAMTAGPEIGQTFGWPALTLSEGQKEWRQRLERSRLEQERMPPELLMPDWQLMRPDIVPADQPTNEGEEGFYYKRRL